MNYGKRYIWSTKAKHKWHLDLKKVKRLNSIYEQIKSEKVANGKQ